MSALRPATFDEFIGNEDVKKCLKIHVDAAKKGGKKLPHTLFKAFSGSGKTTLSLIMGQELGVETTVVNAANLRELKQLYPLVGEKLKDRDILFLDEIHRIDKRLQEFLFTILEDQYYVVPSKDMRRGATRIEVNDFTVIGATTDPGKLSEPFLNRFAVHYTLLPYTQEELVKMAAINAQKLGLKIDGAALEIIARTSKGVPRVLNNRLEWIKDYSISKGVNQFAPAKIMEALTLHRIDETGLDQQDRDYLEIVEKHGPIGLNNIANMMNVRPELITNNIEPYLMRQQLVFKTGRGRVTKRDDDIDLSDLLG